jgi:hypothetical protein
MRGSGRLWVKWGGQDGIGEELFPALSVLLWCKAWRFWLEGGLLVVLNRAYAFVENNA